MSMGVAGSKGGRDSRDEKYLSLNYLAEQISFYEETLSDLPESKTELRKSYLKAIHGLKELKQKISRQKEGDLTKKIS